MLKTRVIPALLLHEGKLVKTVRFQKPGYVGDPVNTVRIFNELEVDELVFLDIEATRAGKPPDFKLLGEIADECFMPLSYGGGIRSLDHVKRVLSGGLEKVIINSFAVESPEFISKAAAIYGSQAIIASIDVKKNLFRGYQVYTASGTKGSGRDPVRWAKELETLGAGEILLTSIDHEGTWQGYDLELIRSVCEAVNVPVIAHGGAGTIRHLEDAVRNAGASALALGSMVVYQKKDLGVLVNFPDREELARCLA